MFAVVSYSHLRAFFLTRLIVATSLTAGSASPPFSSQMTSPEQKAQIVETMESFRLPP
jgi:hypothetical protein